MTEFRFTPLVQSLPSTVPFVGPETQERNLGKPFKARLGANENVFGPSPRAIRAMAETGHWMYGGPESYDLRTAIASFHKTSVDHIVVGEGIDGLLGYLVRLFIGQGDVVVSSDGAYPTFNYHVNGFGGMLHKVPYQDDHEDPAALFLKAAEVNAKLVYLANPDNPMGSFHTGAALETAMAGLPANCLLVLDEAYVDTAPQGTALAVSPDDRRVIRMRTCCVRKEERTQSLVSTQEAYLMILLFVLYCHHTHKKSPAEAGLFRTCKGTGSNKPS